MDKRLAKRHKRQVARARENVKISEPDVRTPEEIKAAREKSQANASRSDGMNTSRYASRDRTAVDTGSAAKTAV